MTTDIPSGPSAVHAIAVNIGAAVAKRSTCCPNCGCLIFTWETCPACALADAHNHHVTGATA